MLDDVFDFINSYNNIFPYCLFNLYNVRELNEDNGYLVSQELDLLNLNLITLFGQLVIAGQVMRASAKN